MTDTINLHSTLCETQILPFRSARFAVLPHIRPSDLTITSPSNCVETTVRIPSQTSARANPHYYYSQHPVLRLISSRAASDRTVRAAYLPPRPPVPPPFRRYHRIGSQRAFGIKSYRTWQIQPPPQSRAAVSSLCCLERQPLERCVAQAIILSHQSHPISEIDQTPASAVWLHHLFPHTLLPHHTFKKRRS